MSKRNGDVNEIIRLAYKKAGVGTPPSTRVIDIRDLSLDLDYQREATDYQIDKLRSEFVPASACILIVSEREDGTRFIVDGNHRRCALIEEGITHWPVQYHTGLTPKQESKIWRYCNDTRKNATPAQKFKQRLFVGDEKAIEIRHIVEGEHGFILSLSSKRSFGRKLKKKDSYLLIYAIVTVEKIYNYWGPDGLRRVLHVIKQAWDPDEHAEATDATALYGLAIFLGTKEWRNLVDIDRLIRQLSRTTPRKLLKKAMYYNEAFGRNAATAFSDAVHAVYNHRLITRRLPSREIEEEE